jgi:hypothetical protein
MDQLSELGRAAAPAERLTVADQRTRHGEALLASCPALLHLSDVSTAEDTVMQALQARIALRYADDPWVQYQRLVEGKFAAPAAGDAAGQPPPVRSGAPNRGFGESDIVSYDGLAARDRPPPSVHAAGGETAAERFLTMQAPFEALETYEAYRNALTNVQGRMLAVEQRIAHLQEEGATPLKRQTAEAGETS